MGRDTPSPEPMVYSFIYICRSPQLRTVIDHGAPRGRKAYMQ